MSIPGSSSTWGIVLAAGRGVRLDPATPKQFLRWKDRPLWWHSASTMARSPFIHGLVLVFAQDRLPDAEQELAVLERTGSLGIPIRFSGGGEQRQHSVRNALKSLPAECAFCLVHDAARPFFTPNLLRTVMEPLLAAAGLAGAVPALRLTDTVKEVDHNRNVLRTPDRSCLWAVQTPQAFRVAVLKNAHRLAEQEKILGTDDASLVERYGGQVMVVEGEADNRKITHPADLALLREDRKVVPCSGFGYDVHRYGGARPLLIGGVAIPGDYSVHAHSDGDVLLHALMDAILGCVGGGDIGRHFPDDAPEYDGISSSLLLDRVMEIAAGKGLSIANVDLTVVAQKPRLAPHAQAIRRNVARLLRLPEDYVNFKATTEEGLGFTGQAQGLKAIALVAGLR